MPDFSKVAAAFDIPYYKVNEQSELDDALEKVYSQPGPVICEWPQDPDQTIEPRVMNRKSDDGCIISTPIDDLAPFLAREEYEGMQFEAWVQRKH